MPFIMMLLGQVARFLLSGIIARVVFMTVLNTVLFAAMIKFYRNFASSSLDFALSFFGVLGFGDVVSRIQGYFNQLPPVVHDMWSYFGFGAMMGFLINSYVSGIFLAWICRKFG